MAVDFLLKSQNISRVKVALNISNAIIAGLQHFKEKLGCSIEVLHGVYWIAYE